MALSEFGKAYLENLADLNSPDRRFILTLKDLAFENPSESSNVVRAIRQHIKQCSAAHRLPALYLVDCMLKSEPCPSIYAEQLSQALLEIFVFVWDNADATTRPALTKLCKLWRMVPRLDQKVVQACETYMVPAGQASTSGGGPASGRSLPPPGYGGYPVTQPHQPRPSAPYGQPPAAVGNAPIFDSRGMGQPVQVQQLAVPSAPFPAAHVTRPAYLPARPPTVLVPMPAFIPAQQPQLSYTAPAAQQPLPFAVRPVAPVHFAAAAGPAPIPQSGPLIRPALLSMHAASLPALQQVAAPASPQPAPHSPQQPPPQRQQSSARPRSTEFPGPRALQELDETAVQDLRETSDRTRPAFLDAAFLRNKRRATQAASGATSRQWYPSVDLWLVGTTSAAAADITDGQPEGEEVETDRLFSVEEDPSQPECAISGEVFERFYDPDSDKWCYKDAVVLTGEEAAKYNVMDGSIVKVQCLGGAPSKLQMATLRAATAAAAAADELQQATAAQPGGSGAGSSAGGAASAQPPLGVGQAEPAWQQLPAAVATTAHLAQPVSAAVLVKEEPHAGGAMGVVGAAASDVHGLKRHAGPGDAVLGMASGPGFHEAKRVKLEVQ